MYQKEKEQLAIRVQVREEKLRQHTKLEWVE